MVWIMAAELQGKYTIISNSNYESAADLWLPHVFILWHDEQNQMRSQHFDNLGQCFHTRAAAEDFGLAVARACIIGKFEARVVETATREGTPTADGRTLQSSRQSKSIG